MATGREMTTRPKGGSVMTYDESLYELYDDDALEAEQEEREQKESSSEFDKLGDGRNVRRVLPPPRGSKWGPKGKPSPIMKVWQHWVEVPGAKRKTVFNCPKKMKGEYCGACETAAALRRSGNPMDKDIGWNLMPKASFLVNWVDRADESAGPKLGKFGPMIHDGMLEVREENGDYSHPVDGYDLVIKKKVKKQRGQQDQISYKVFADPSGKSPLADPEVGIAWIRDQFELEDYAEVPDEDQMDELMDAIKAIARSGGGGGGGRRRRRSDDEDDKPRGSARSRRDDDDDEDDEDDEKPRGRASRRVDEDTKPRGRSRREDDDDDDEDDDED